MSATETLRGTGVFGRLRGLVREPAPAVERCELCGRGIGEHHEHLLDVTNRQLRCACTACALLFDHRGDGSKLRRVPRRIRSLPDFRMATGQWNAMGIPVNLAFFYRMAATGQVVACYPGPGGATESLISAPLWDELVAANPVLHAIDDDVEALLVNRAAEKRGAGDPDYFLVPADECYRLIGLMKLHWQGFGGGDAVWHEIGEFFDGLRRLAAIGPVPLDA
jgi:hypothetical protein